MQGPLHTASEWERIAKSTKGQDLWWCHQLTPLSLNQIVVYNEKGARCPINRCGRFVEFCAYSSRRGYDGTGPMRRGNGPMRRTAYLCPEHAEEFAEIYGLDWPPYVPDKFREEP